jgi:alkanesulfonate monooxygenase SsuD/methylene tetrahydromethanopterin reductase-like flavin-dependent oxidoreductase (luciferase family)
MKLSMKLSIQGDPWNDVAAFFRHADGIPAYDVGWVNDHLYNPRYPDRSDDPATFEAYTALAALAATTSRIRLGAMVGANLFRTPALVARMAATIDHVSGGRFELGIGAGWHEREHDDLGTPLLPPGDRVTAFEESLTIIRSLLTEPRTTFAGRFHTVTDAASEPKPVQSRVPIVVGAFRPRMLRVTARHADHWNYDGKDPDAFAEALAGLHRACEAVGREPREIEVSVQYWPQRMPETSLREITERFVAAGADHMVLAFLDPDHDLLERAAAELDDL